ncbi:hypothetical protein EC844_12429 [Acinetobacter calcoaceticus]|uniref:Uncharacterized protein n=1 Tax=Acinetobacter calcoaceticus TaxID=471 RepID=A0A4R1XIC2_ACICA|nr:hypothetical protein EC844_12429 [Acinetobacter calcoaceticus]
MMKLLLVAACLVSITASANELRCVDSYPLFKKLDNDSVFLFQHMHFEDMKKFSDKYSYTLLFSAQHPAQTFSYGKWKDKAQAEQDARSFHRFSKSLNLKVQEYRYNSPKLNYISTQGEVCVVPVVFKYTMLEKEYVHEYDMIYVRNLNAKKWRAFKYIGIETKKDFDEFFPDFPNTVRLSDQKVNGLNYADSGYAMSNAIYQEFDFEITDEVTQGWEKEKQESATLLKNNGY